MILFIRIILIFAGTVLFSVSIGMRISEDRRRRNCTKVVTAEVIELLRVESTVFDTYSPTVLWYPVYEYWTGQGTVRIKSSVGGKENKYEIGQKIELYINPEDSKEIYSPSDSTKLIQMILGTIGMVLVISCAVLDFFRM